MDKTLLILALTILCLAPSRVASADGPETEVVIIHLKNKGQLQGLVKSRDEKGVVIDLGYGTSVIPAVDIDRIETPRGEEKDGLIDSWRRRARTTQKSEKERKKDAEDVRRRIEESLRHKQELEERARKKSEHRIGFTDSSKIKVEALLNGKIKTELVVDTGANTVLIPMDIARDIPGIGPLSGEKVETKLADGTVREGTPVVLRSVEVAGLKAENVDALAMDLKGHDGLLGMSFLSRFHVWIDSGKKELILKEKRGENREEGK